MNINSNLTMVKHIPVKLRLVLAIVIGCILTTGSAFADYEQATNKDIVSVGAGIKVYSAPYSGQNGYTEPFPTIEIELNRFFVKGLMAGYRFYDHKRVSLGVAANYGREFLDLNDINDKNQKLYYGIEERDAAVEIGFVGRFYSRVGLVEGTFFKDISDAHDGTRSSLKISRPIPDTGNWTLVPSFYVNYYSEKFNNYYYGVSDAENTAGLAIAVLKNEIVDDPLVFSKQIRSTYEPGNSGHVGFDLDIKYAFTENVRLVANIAIEKFAGEVETSPLTEDKELITTVIGLAYEF